MLYKINGKTIKIPDNEITVLKNSLSLSQSEAVQTWLEDNDYCKNEEQEELDEKAKNSGILSTIHGAREKKNMKDRKKPDKEDPVKEQLIKDIYTAISTINGLEDIKITNKTKIIEFIKDDENFSLDLIRHRPKKGEK